MTLIRQFPSTSSITGFLGFDDLMSRLEQDFSKSLTKLSYPPYNVWKNESAYTIEVALAGFAKHEITVKKDNEYLYINAEKDGKADDGSYLHKGIAYRDVHLSFKLADGVVVKKVKFDSGLLKVNLEHLDTKNDIKTFDIE